jgi:autotransporter strand-loop-strand O-heptosyltransferase
MKILYLAPHLSTGGMPQFLLKRIEALQDKTDVEIFVVEYQCHSFDYVVQRNAIIKLIGKSNFYTLSENKEELLNIINDINPDIVHIDEMSERLNRETITKLYYPDRKYRIVETCHDISFNPSDKIFTPDAYAFCTPYHLDTFANLGGYNQVIEYPIDNNKVSLSVKRQSKEFLEMDLQKRHVVNVGLWTRGKNQGEGLDIARKYPTVMFHFVGNQAENFKDYWEPLMKNIPENVKIWGERTDVSVFMQAADIFMFNSTWECNPLVLKEAISYGIPIIAKNLPQYKGMYDAYIGLSADLNSPLLGLLMKYKIPTNNTTKNFAKNNLSLYKKAMSVIPNKEPIKDYNITQNFVGQPFIEITGTSKSDFTIEFYDGNNYLVHRDVVKANHWVKVNKEYYIKWTTKVYKDGELVYTNVLDYTNKRVYIAFDSSSLGDNIAWIPYIEEFRKKHNCKIIVSTFKNFLFESEYPEIEFVEPGISVSNIYGMYKLGWFYDYSKEPVLPSTIPLQQAATNILGLDYIEIKPEIIGRTSNRAGVYVTIATNSTAGCKFWTREGWQEVINYLYEKGLIVINTSLESNPFDNCEPLSNTDMNATIAVISNSKFFIGLSSGLSWLAWALDVPVIMISNFTEANHEFSCHRVTNTNVCHGCWNDPKYTFDKGDWDWCPVHKGTDRQFECHKEITSQMVVEQIKKLM